VEGVTIVDVQAWVDSGWGAGVEHFDNGSFALSVGLG
jgi:maltoporin